MEQFKLLDINGSGEKIFCALMQIAIDELVKNQFGDSKASMPFIINSAFITKAYEKLKTLKVDEIDGQQIQEFLVTSILQYYLEQIHTQSVFRIAFPNDKSEDSIIIESPKDMTFRKLGDKFLPNEEVTVYHFQIKEVREKGDLLKNISAGISEAKEEGLIQTGLFDKFRKYFYEKILRKDYGGTILLLFLRAPSFMKFNTRELMEEFQKLNAGYFGNIWFIAAVDRLVDQDGKESAMNQKTGTNFHFYIKELINSDPDFFTVVNMGCAFNKFYSRQGQGVHRRVLEKDAKISL